MGIEPKFADNSPFNGSEVYDAMYHDPTTYDPRLDAVGALALGGVGALSGLGLSLLSKRQRKNKLRNALIGATMLPAAYLGAKQLKAWDLKKNNPDGQKKLYTHDPIYKYISSPVIRRLGKLLPNEAARRAEELSKELIEIDEKAPLSRTKEEKQRSNDIRGWGQDSPGELDQAASDAISNYDSNIDNARTMAAIGGYGTLGSGIGVGLLSLLLGRSKKVDKKKQFERGEISPEEYLKYLREEGLA